MQLRCVGSRTSAEGLYSDAAVFIDRLSGTVRGSIGHCEPLRFQLPRLWGLLMFVMIYGIPDHGQHVKRAVVNVYPCAFKHLHRGSIEYTCQKLKQQLEKKLGKKKLTSFFLLKKIRINC